jgi:PAS domain S-box-containing protein
MHSALFRQLRRIVGCEDEAAFQSLLLAAGGVAEAGALPEPVARLLHGFGALMERVEATYAQYDRDLELRSRSLAISSQELGEANERLQQELESRERAIQSLRQVVGEMLPEVRAETEAGKSSDDLESVTQLLSILVSEREASRRDLSNQQFALNQHAIVSITDLAGTIIYANDRFCQISGYSREELIGQNHRIVRSGQHPQAYYESMWETITSGLVWEGEVCNRAKNGRLYWVAATIVPFCDERGLPFQYIAIRTDITARKEAESQLLHAKELAEAANRSKSEFLANMSHEIRTPMNGIIGMTDLALDTPLTNEQREYLQVVKNSSDALLTIINDILDFSKIEAGKLHVEKISFDLPRLFAETLKTLSLRAHEKSLELVCDIAPDVPQRLIADPGRVRQVLVNLVGNSIKFTDRGEIVVRAERFAATGNEPELLHVSVRDTGIGIPLEKQALVFEAFTQEDGSITRRYGGTGLGLTISSRLVSMMGGTMWLESEPGVGSTFHFTLALREDRAAAQKSALQQGLAGYHAMIVDDNAANRKVLQGLLGKWEMASLDYASAQDALDVLMAGDVHFDVILLDVQMPDMDGFAFAEQLFARPPASGVPPIVMLTSAAMRGDAQRCQELGVSAYFSKPIAPDELFGALHKLLGHKAGGTAAVTLPEKSDAMLVTRHSLRESLPVLDILLAEDHPVNQKLALTLLEKWGQRVTLAQNGREACHTFVRSKFDLVLMDVQMPEMDGYDATRCIRMAERRRNLAPTPIIAMTANAMQGDQERCLAVGMSDYLSKPIKPAELYARLAEWAAQCQPQQAHSGEAVPEAQTGELEAVLLPASTFDYGAALNEADAEIVEIVAGMFLERIDGELAELEQAIANRDAPLVQRLAHTIKGNLAMFNAEPARREAAQLEEAGMGGYLEGLEDGLMQLCQEMAALKQVLLARFPQAGSLAGD